MRNSASAVVAACIVLLGVLPMAGAETPLVRGGQALAVLVIPDAPEPVAAYAADELAYHVHKASGVRVPIVHESSIPSDAAYRIYIGETRAAQRAGIDVDALPSEAFVLRSAGNDLIIAGKDGPGDPLSAGNSFSGALFGVYEVLERDLGVCWLWPGDLGEFVPSANAITLGAYDETVPPRFNRRNLRPGLGLRLHGQGDERLGFSLEERARYARTQSVFLRRHRMGRSSDSYHAQRSFGGGHAFGGWWERYGESNPEFFQLLPDGRRGPRDPENRPHDVSMCVSNPDLHRKIVELWAEERAKNPGQPLNIGIGENDTAAQCVCEACRAWDGPEPDLDAIPPGLERSFTPVQAGTRYARFAQAVHRLASAIDPDVKIHFYAYYNYFWAPTEEVELHPNINIGFVPWFRWAGWFPRTDEQHEWIKEQWLGWQRTGASVFYRPNWFLDGYTQPLVYMTQFADAFKFYAENGMAGTDFDSLLGQWAAQGPNLYLLARIHTRPEMPLEELLGEYYQAFGPAADEVEEYFNYWEQFALDNRDVIARSIQTRRGGAFRRYAHYALVADEIFPPEVYPPAYEILDRAAGAARGSGDPIHAERVEFLRIGLDHALACIESAQVMNTPDSTVADRAAALTGLATYRRSLEHIGIANMDRASSIEQDSWKELEGFADSWTLP